VHLRKTVPVQGAV